MTTESLVTENELKALQYYARNLRTIVEIGSYKGGSAIAMAEVSAGNVFCVDLWDEHTGQKRYTTAKQDFYKNVDKAGLTKRVFPIQMPSARASKLWPVFQREIDLLFIDGCHKYNYVKADFENWSPWVAGFVAFHDYAPEKKFGKDVARFVDEIGPEWKRIEIVEKLIVLRRVRAGA